MSRYEERCAHLSPAMIIFADSKVAVIEAQIARRPGARMRHDASKLPARLRLRDSCRIECAMAAWTGRDWLGWKGRGQPDVDGFECRGSRFAMAGMTVYRQDLAQHPGLPMAWCRLVNVDGKKQGELNLVVCNGWFPLDKAKLEACWWTEAYDVGTGDRNPKADYWLVPYSFMSDGKELLDVIQ